MNLAAVTVHTGNVTYKQPTEKRIKALLLLGRHTDSGDVWQPDSDFFMCCVLNGVNYLLKPGCTVFKRE